MTYEANVAVWSEMRTKKKFQRKASTMYNFWMLNLVVRKETTRL